MALTIFATLCDICNDLDRAVNNLKPGAPRERLEELVKRLDAAIDRTIGLEQTEEPTPPYEETHP
jgi:hypothetical protein